MNSSPIQSMCIVMFVVLYAKVSSTEGTKKRERGISSLVLNVQELSDNHSDVFTVKGFPLKVFTVSELLEQRMLC